MALFTRIHGSVAVAVSCGTKGVVTVTETATVDSEGNEEDAGEDRFGPMHETVWKWNYVVTVTTLSIIWSHYPIMANEGITRYVCA